RSMSEILRLIAMLTTAIGFAAIALLSQHQDRRDESLKLAPIMPADHATQGQAPNSLEGIWLSDGYGLLLEIKRDRIRAHQITSISCLPAWTAVRQPEPGKAGEAAFRIEGRKATAILVTSGPSPDVKHFRIPESAAWIIVFRRTAGLPEICKKAAED